MGEDKDSDKLGILGNGDSKRRVKRELNEIRERIQGTGDDALLTTIADGNIGLRLIELPTRTKEVG